jgi:hypothetical protein
MNSGLPYPTINALAVDPRNSSAVYAGLWGDGVFKSMQTGESWSAANSGLANAFIYVLAVDPQNSGTLYAGTGGGLFKSTDGE